MSQAKTIINESLNKNPLAIKEFVDAILNEKCKEFIETIKPEFGNAVMSPDQDIQEEYDLNDPEELEQFFEDLQCKIFLIFFPNSWWDDTPIFFAKNLPKQVSQSSYSFKIFFDFNIYSFKISFLDLIFCWEYMMYSI